MLSVFLLFHISAGAYTSGDLPNGILDPHIHLIHTKVHDMIPKEQAYLTKYGKYTTHKLHDYNIATAPIVVDEVIPIECGVRDAGAALDEVLGWKAMLKEQLENPYVSPVFPRAQYSKIIPFAPIALEHDGHSAAEMHRYLVLLKRLASPLRVVGVRRLIQIEDDNNFACTATFKQGLKVLHEFDSTWFFDVGIEARQLPCIVNLVKEFPTMRFLIDHHAKPDFVDNVSFEAWRDNMSKLAQSSNVWIKLSGLVNQVQNGEQNFNSYTEAQVMPYVSHLIQVFGYERCMFASNWFVVDTFSSWRSWFDMLYSIVDKLGATPDQKDQIFRSTAKLFHV